MKHIQKDEKLSIRRPIANFTTIENALIENHHKLGLSLYDFGFIVHLLKWSYTSYTMWPSLRTLGQEMGLHYANVRRKLLQLEKMGLLKIERQTNGSKQYSSILDLTPLYEKLHSVVRETTGVVRETTGVVRETTKEEKRRKINKKPRIEREKRAEKSKSQEQGNSEEISDEQIKNYVEILYKEGKVKNPDAFIVSTRKALREGDLKPDDILRKIKRYKKEKEVKELLKNLSDAASEIYFNGEIKSTWKNTSKEDRDKYIESAKEEVAALKDVMTEEERKEVSKKLVFYAMVQRYKEVKHKGEGVSKQALS